MSDIHVSQVRNGVPDLSFKNDGAFTKGRTAALSVEAAGPGHHVVASFDANENTRMTSFISGARYVAKKNPSVKVSRRKVDQSTVLIYIVNNTKGLDTEF